VKAIRTFTVRSSLPESLRPLEALATNLRWSWHEPTRELFREVSLDAWRGAGHDPIQLLGRVGQERIAELAADEGFVGRVHALAQDLDDYLSQARWYQSLDGAPRSIGYFSPEFGITSALPQYSGGLGILAGDHLKAASDLGIPIVGVGLFYQAGYFRQAISAEGWQQESYPVLDPDGLPLTVLRDDDGVPVLVTLALPGDRTLHARIWEARVGRVPLLLLDTVREADRDTSRNPRSRRTVHQATGMVLERFGLSASDALALLQAHAYTVGLPVAQVAADIVEGRSRFLDPEPTAIDGQGEERP